MTRPEEPKRRFAPVPIETTFQSVRRDNVIGPNLELTPEPSPRTPSPTIPDPPPLRRRFKPQLIETSRRTHRAGDAGPATRPTDKTDITPYTNHIYLAKSRPRRRRGDSGDDEPLRHMPPTRRESEDEGVKEYLLELAAKEAARQIEEAALAAFPNSRAREGGVAHFYFRESSGSDNSDEHAPRDNDRHGQSRARRKSSDLDLNWWHRHMQEHAEHLAEERVDDDMAVDHQEDTIMRTDSDLDRMDLAVPPDPLWTTTNKIAPDDRRDSMVEIHSLRQHLKGVAPDRIFGDDGPQAEHDDIQRGRPETHKPVAAHLAADTGHRAQDGGFGRPFGAFGLPPADPKLHRIRQAASPPMLGKDLTFRFCPSPQQTKLETDHPFVEEGGPNEKDRDPSGDGGLWRGYCCRSESNGGYIVPVDMHNANMIVTPQPPGSPREPLSFEPLTEDPSSVYASSSDSSGSPPGLWKAEHRPKTGAAAKGLHLLHGLDERLRREKAQAELDEKIAQEFDDEFVTQVYNYLSLGYPAMAHSFDEELAKISGMSVEDLGRDDEKQMAKGHMLEMKLEDSPEEERCPRWKALKSYIMVWARQHPDLDSRDSLAWGVRERRGSWAI